jgi:hypothetical protein
MIDWLEIDFVWFRAVLRPGRQNHRAKRYTVPPDDELSADNFLIGPRGCGHGLSELQVTAGGSIRRRVQGRGC